MTKLQKQLAKARDVVGCFEFGAPEWEEAMQKVRALVDAINSATPPAPWSDREWSNMMNH